MSEVFDSSVLLAFLFREPGGEAVEPRILGGHVSAVNVAEVIAKLVERGYRDEAALALADRACLTLAARLGATAVTADRAWTRQDLGIPVDLVR